MGIKIYNLPSVETQPGNFVQKGGHWSDVVSGGSESVSIECLNKPVALSAGSVATASATAFAHAAPKSEKAPKAVQEHLATFNEVFDQHVLADVELRLKDVKNVKCRVSVFVEFIGDKPIAQISASDIREFFKWACISQATCNRYLSALNPVFNAAVEEGLIDQNPAAKIKRFRDNNKDERVFSDVEAKRFVYWNLQYRDPIPSLALLLAALTGARIGNIVSIERDNISKDCSSILLPVTKSGKAQFIYLSDPAQVLVNRLLKMPSSKWLFPSKRSSTGHISNPKACWVWILKQMDDEGVLEGHAKIHSLRHLFGTRALSATGNLQLVSTALGHSDVSVTTRYTHTRSSELKAAANAVATSILGDLSLDVDQ